MYSIKFPDMISGVNTKVIKGHDATYSNLRLMLLSDKYGLFGDPYYGTNLKKLLFNQNNQVLKDLIIDDIYSSILTFMPQLLIRREDISIESKLGKVYVNIKTTNLLDYQTNLYTINLTETEEL